MKKIFIIALILVLTASIVLAVQNDSEIKSNNSKNGQSDKNDSFEKNQTDQGIGQALNIQISERKEEIRTGDYNSSLGQSLRVRELSQTLRELRINDVSVTTELNITAEMASDGKTKFKTELRNGREIEIKIMPDVASEKALAKLRLNVCSTDNNCTFQLKSVGNNNAEKIQYEMQLERHSKILGLFQKKANVSAEVHAETGDTKVHRPWWTFMATTSTN